MFYLSHLSLLNCQNLILVDGLNAILAFTDRKVKRIQNMLLTSVLSQWSLSYLFLHVFSVYRDVMT